MNYIVNNGCITYYDSILSDDNSCDPNMLFILGLESCLTQYHVCSCDCSDSCSICNDCKLGVTVQSEGYCTEEDCSCLPYRNQMKLISIPIIENNPVIDNVKSYLETLGPIELKDNNIIYYCGGLKYFIYSMTGISNERSIPVFLSRPTDKANSLILNKSVNYIFYESSTLYKLVNYQAIYSFSLGVLFGCIYQGFDQTSVLTTSPSTWYTGNLINLVNDAWYAYRFRQDRSLPEIDHDYRLFNLYKGIKTNKIWNTYCDLTITNGDLI